MWLLEQFGTGSRGQRREGRGRSRRLSTRARNAIPGRACQATPNAIDVTINGYFDIGCGTCANALFKDNVAEFSDDVDIIRGRITCRSAGIGSTFQYPYQNTAYANGNPQFSGIFSNDGLLDFLTGNMSYFDQGNPTQFNGRQNYIGFYFNDNFQVSKRLNLNLGLRWEPNLSVTETHNSVDHFSQTAFLAGTDSNQFVNAPAGFFFPGDPGIPRGYVNNDWTALEPRVGIVWNPTGSGRQVIRSGYGLFYDTIPTAYFEDQTQGAPWGSVIDLINPPGGPHESLAGSAGWQPFPATLSARQECGVPLRKQLL